MEQRPWDYRLQLLYQPDTSRLEPELHIAPSLEADAACRIVVDSSLWKTPIKELLEVLKGIEPQRTEDNAYYNCGVEIVGPRHHKVLVIQFNQQQATLMLNGKQYRGGSELAAWWNKNVEPIFRQLVKAAK